MPDFKRVSQKNWLKGLQATFARFSQPQGILTRVSNLLYDKRGGMRQSDGSLIFASQGEGTAQGAIAEIALYSPTGQSPYYVDIQKSLDLPFADVSGIGLTPIQVGGTIATAVSTGISIFTVSIGLTGPHNFTNRMNPLGIITQGGNTNPIFNHTVVFGDITITGPNTYSYQVSGIGSGSGTGGTVGTQLVPGTYTYDVTASDGQGGETQGSGSPVSLVLAAPNNAITVSWAPVANAFGYDVYGRVSGSLGQLNGSGPQIANLVQSGFIDIGGNTPTAPEPTQNTTQQLGIFRLNPPAGAQLLGTYPSFFAPPLGGIPGATGAASTASPGAGATPQGGVIGAAGPLPQIVQFANKLIFALGNGIPIQEFLDPNSGGSGAITAVNNNFTAQYPDWQASVSWNQGDSIKDSVSGGIFLAQQAGTSGATRPVFNDTLNALTPDVPPGTVVWKCTAVKFMGTPLRGAACVRVYAGSLWIANTWPVTTADQLDGPNCVKMSDVNNEQSWNPANVAFLAKDDGDQITGLDTFTIAEAGIAPTGSLVVWKNFSTFQITGVFGAADLTIQQAQTDMGNIAPRSSTYIPGFGLMRLTHLGFAYFNGVTDKLTSEEIRPYLFGGQKDISGIDWNFAYLSKGAQAANPPMYLCAAPIMSPPLAGVTITGTVTGNVLYARVAKLMANTLGIYEDVAVSSEVMVFYNPTTAPQVTVVTPATVAGVKYRIFAGFNAGGENQYLEGTSFNGTYVLSTFSPGFLPLGNGGLTRLFAYDLVIKQWTIIDLPFEISALKQVRSPGTVPLTIAGGASDGSVRRLFAGDQTWDNGDQVSWAFTSAELFQEGGSGKIYYRRLVIRGSDTANASIAVTINLQGKRKLQIIAADNDLGDTEWDLRVDICQDAENANAQVSGTGPILIESLDWYVKPKVPGAPISIQK